MRACKCVCVCVCVYVYVYVCVYDYVHMRGKNGMGYELDDKIDHKERDLGI